MATQAKSKELKSTGYEVFILLLSLVSIVNLGVVFLDIFLNVDPNTRDVLAIIDTILTVFFLFDFLYRILTTSSKSGYFFKRWAGPTCWPVFPSCASSGCSASSGPAVCCVPLV